MSEEYDQDVIEQLKLSKQQQGYLQTVKKDQHGNVLSGRHRLEADSNWPTETVEVKDDLDRELKIIHYNIQRKIPMEETQARLLKIAEILEAKEVPIAKLVSQISKLVPYSEQYIRRLLPAKYKMGQMARLVQCDRCLMASRETTEYKGSTLCPSCLEQAKRKPVKSISPATVEITEPKVYKPKETWAHRKAAMQVPVSHMEQRLAKRLTEAGVAFESQKEYCIRKTVPDFVIGDKAFYVDYEKLHVKREEKDEEARSRLARFYDVEPFGLPYKADTKAEEDRLFAEIMDAVNAKEVPPPR